MISWHEFANSYCFHRICVTVETAAVFDVKIEYVPITAEEFAEKIAGFKSRLKELNEHGAKLDKQIAENLESLVFDENAGRDE